MPDETIVVERRFCGPPESANGGYVSGRLAAFLDGPAVVRLWAPPPLDVPLEVERGEAGVALLHRGDTLAEAWSAPLELDVPAAPGWVEAESAAARFRGFEIHPFPGCFACGPERGPGDGLRIFAGPLAGREIVAGPWTPDVELAGEDGCVAPEFVWAALDCPGSMTFPQPPSGVLLLGELAAELRAPVRPGEPHVVIAWHLGGEGRRTFTGSALFDAGGALLALARGVWFHVER